MPSHLVPECVFCGDDTSNGGSFAFEGNQVSEQPILVGLCEYHWLRLYKKMATEGWLPFHKLEKTRLINFVPPEETPMTEKVQWTEDDDIPEGVDDWPIDSTIVGSVIMSDSEYDEFVAWLNGPGKAERLMSLYEMFRESKNAGS